MASPEVEFANGRKRGIREKIEETREFIYTPQTGFFGREPVSWGQISLFYFVFYTCLIAFFAIALAIFFTTIDGNYPKHVGMETVLKGNPGMGFRPMPDVDSTLIRFEQGKEESYRVYSDHIQSFLDQYENEKQTGENFIDCRQTDRTDPEKVCRFHLEDLGPECVFQKDFGYFEGVPCVLLKLNKVYGWEPQLYDNKTRPPGAPEGWEPSPTGIPVTCEGENPADEENMGPLDIYPPQGFYTYFFPYLNQEGYRQPIVMLHFAAPTPGVVLQIWCKAWAKNIKHNRNDRSGSVHFEMLVD